MDKKTIGNWIMYHEIQRLIRQGISFAAIGKVLVVDQRTVKRYSRMSEADYASLTRGSVCHGEEGLVLPVFTCFDDWQISAELRLCKLATIQHLCLQEKKTGRSWELLILWVG